MSVAWLFWSVAGGDMLVLLVLAADAVLNPHGQFAGLVVVMFLAAILLLGMVMVGVALIRRPAAYWIGLALVIWPPVYWAAQYFGQWATTPSESSLAAGHGYFPGVPERALADAIVAGDAAKVAALASAAKLDTVGWDRMTFMRLALDDGHADPGVVVALLKAGANPEQDQQYLFGSMNDGSGATSGAMITGERKAAAGGDRGRGGSEPAGSGGESTVPHRAAVARGAGGDAGARGQHGDREQGWQDGADVGGDAVALAGG